MAKLGYTINPGKSAVIEFNETRFAQEVETLGEHGYELDQVFEGYDIIEIKTIVLIGVQESRVKEVEDLYGFTWSERKQTAEGEYEYIFRLIRSVHKTKGYKIATHLATIFGGEYQLYSRWKEQCIEHEKQDVFIQANAIKEIVTYKGLADSVNEGAEALANIQAIDDVVRRLKQPLQYDRLLNIVPGYGPPFSTAVSVLGSVEAAARFFNSEYESGFFLDSGTNDEYVIEGRALTGAGVYLSEHGGYMRTGAKQDVKMSNFTMKVHYKIIRPSGEQNFVVSLENDKGKTLDHIEWKNSSSEQMITDHLMKYGNFHIYGGKESVLKLHEMISSSMVPTIRAYAQYGLNEYKGNSIMIFPNGVWDISQKKFFPKHESLPYTFLGSYDGIFIDNSLSDSEVNTEQVAHFHAITDNKLSDYVNITRQMYTDDSATILWMYSCSMAGLSAYYNLPYVPSYYVSGVTGSGKSTFSTFIARSFGVKSLYNIRESTVYPLKILLSSFKGLPAFLSEYRSEMKYADDKKGLIQMCYDRSETAKGLKTGGVLKYRMESQVFCEGEDTYDEGSIRTRSIKFTCQKKSRKESSLPMEILKANESMIQSFYSTYLAKTDETTYLEYQRKGQKLFAKQGVEPRISDNIGFLYAGCMAFAPEMEDEIVRLCSFLLNEQVADYNENGESQKIVRLLSQYLNKRWATVYFELGYIILDWNDILEFRNKTKIADMQLSMDAYKGHLVSLGWESDFYEVQHKDEFGKAEDKMINGIRIKALNCPRDLLTNSNVYAAYRQAKKEG